jgi:hypothetical protein
MKRSGTTTDEDIRSSPLGFFNVAESYWAGAAALERAELQTTHPNSPISFLYYHAIELYLKAFLRLHGHSAKELRGKKFGHNTCCLSERAVALGLRSMMRICKFSHSWPARTQLFDHDTSKQDIFVGPHPTLWTALAEVCGNLLVKH